ncbi:MAG TPA: EAL domain-containing protein [Methylophilaceae bacterium]|nr:EAL domain-containing protein [Methylophilaceae bacterium]
MDFFSDWIVPSQFMPHGHCYLWTPSLLWTYVVSDSLIFLSYYTIPIALLYFVKKRRDLQFNWVFVMFSLFICACGTTHAISIITIWQPTYWIDAVAKAFTALFSGITAVMLWRLMPVALQVPSTKQLSDSVSQLEREIQQRRIAEVALARANESLEIMVTERTAELTRANELLTEEIEQRKQTEYALFSEKQQALVTLESIGDAVITTNMQSRVTYLNPVAERMTGWSKNDAAGKPILEVFRILNEGTRKLAANPVDVVLAHGVICGLANHTLLVSKNGTEYDIEDSAAPILDHDGTMLGVVLVFHDTSDTKKMAHKMTYLAEHDFLTDLPNRLLLNDRIKQALNSASRRHGKAALMFLDIDHFKKINDTLGHAVGDQLLVQFSKKLQACLRNTDTISRQGGDEFVILLPEIPDNFAAAEIAEKLIEVTKNSFIIDSHELFISASIGIAVYPDDGKNADLLTKHADAAMYHAKGVGRNNYQFFNAEMTQRVAEQLSLENFLQKAVEHNELVLFYQPKVSIKTGKIIGVEALLRWQHPEWGMIAPDRFIPVAEDSGLIRPIGNWVLREACRQNRAWQDMGLPEIPVAVNLSVVELRQPNFVQEVMRVLLQSGMAPSHLEIEVTESIAIKEFTEVIGWLQTLKEMGVRLSIDDFGTGYSSLSYLKRLPIDTIKIDKSFIRDIGIDLNDAAIVTAIISMSHSLKLAVIAEGVETTEQLDFLKQHDCDEIQGYFFSRPLPADEFAKLLAADKTLKS